MKRITPPRGSIVTVRLPFFAAHIFASAASSNSPSVSTASARLFSNVSITWARDSGCGGFRLAVTSKESARTTDALEPGIIARCMASCPRVIDFWCGAHASLSSGSSSSNRRVVCDSCSSSINNRLMVSTSSPLESGKTVGPRMNTNGHEWETDLLIRVHSWPIMFGRSPQQFEGALQLVARVRFAQARRDRDAHSIELPGLVETAQALQRLPAVVIRGGVLGMRVPKAFVFVGGGLKTC